MSTAINELELLTPALNEQELLELERKYCSWGDTVHYLDPPKIFQRAEGHYLYGREGTPYLDLQMWYSAASFGYGNQRLNQVLKDQIDKLPQLACQYLHSEKVELAAAIGRLNESKFGLEGRVHFNVGGAQAIEDSLKIVRNSTGKNLVFAFMGGYHGRTLGASAFSAFYAEPIQATGGYVIPPREYFPALKKILDERNILLVDDEIQMGFYRAGKFWAMENFNVEPDIIVFGKALTNGLKPLSGLWAREELISPEVFPPGSTHSTFSSNPLGTAVGLEAVRMMEEGNYEEVTQRKGAYFLAQIRELQRRYPKVIGNTDGMGMALRIELCQADGFEPDRGLTDKIFAEGMKGDLDARGRRTGLVLDIGGYYKNVFTLAPCFDMTEEEIDVAVELFEQLIRRCAPERV